MDTSKKLNLDDIPNIFPHELTSLDKRLDAVMNAVFIEAKSKLCKKHFDGYEGWEEMDVDKIRARLMEHFTKVECDYVDVVNFAAMLWYLTRLNEISDDDWLKAHDHLNLVIQRYEEIGRMPGANTTFAVNMVFLPLKIRFEEGERTYRLYEDMMEAE